ncbi:enoyl-CoA hydratase/carnithine racemase [Actinocorallia herbida]|uniref:Enoyl-CoA hydratase/carnithine racemase n=1 Tax=Actinocorallia herbida TaxID=58109 RepID=A0A3N1CZT3_9ACTN|nr:crotonase/enoyl-CoA hydratase family protein [Actinocorallia herbida]ROO86795.1 enoyl-CoA hydratase/carnithine racemase [Actinocorallia herbida]
MSRLASWEWAVDYEFLKVRRAGAVLVIGLNRPRKRNAFNVEMLHELSHAYAELDSDPDARVGVLYGEGGAFTAGLDLLSVAPAMQEGGALYPEGGVDPWRIGGRELSKPLVAAVHGKCLTLGIELLLASDIVVADAGATFAQLEVGRGLFPFGGATYRFPRASGWGNAMRWMLTAEEFGAAEALRIGLVQEVTPEGAHVARAVAIAESVARQAPLGVQATLRSARLALREGESAAESALTPEAQKLFTSDDLRVSLESFLTGTPPEYRGR